MSTSIPLPAPRGRNPGEHQVALRDRLLHLDLEPLPGLAAECQKTSICSWPP